MVQPGAKCCFSGFKCSERERERERDVPADMTGHSELEDYLMIYYQLLPMLRKPKWLP